MTNRRKKRRKGWAWAFLIALILATLTPFFLLCEPKEEDNSEAVQRAFDFDPPVDVTNEDDPIIQETLEPVTEDSEDVEVVVAVEWEMENPHGYSLSQDFFNMKIDLEHKGVESDYAMVLADAFERHAATYGVDPYDLLAMATIESGGESPPFDPVCRGASGEIGVMQIMPFHAKYHDWFTEEDLYDPDINIKFAAFYLSVMQKEFGHDLGILAYNQGEGNMRRGTYKTWYLDKYHEKYAELYRAE